MAFCEVESEIDREFDLGVPSDDGFPMNLMSNENITWTVERERGISFDLTALTDPDLKHQGISGGGGGMPLTPDAGAALLDVMRREIKLEAESGVKESTFGHPFGGQCRPQPRPAPPSPFSRGGRGGGGPTGPTKRTLPPSLELRESCSAKRQWDPTPPPQQQQPTRTLGRTRSRSMRPSAAKTAAAAAAPPAATPGRSRSGGGGGRSKAEAAGEGRGSATAGAPPPRRRHVGGVDTVALAAELGLVDSRRYGGGGGRRAKGGVPYRVGAYTLEERAALVARFHAKRGRRIWRKKIKYDCRKKLADKRPRLKGRFVTQEELEGLDQETLAKVTGLGPWPEDEDEAEAGGDAESLSDSSDGDGGSPAARPTATRCRSGGAGKSSRRRISTGKAGSPRKAKKARCGGVSMASAAAAAAAAEAEAAAAAAAAVTSMDEDEEEEEEELDLDDDDGDSSTSAASEDSVGGEEGGGTMKRVSSSYKVSAMFAVKTEADIDMPDHQDHQTPDLIEPQQLVVEEEDEEDYEHDNTGVDAEEYEPTDPVFGFMIDDILSSNFNVVPSRDSSSAAGVAVN